MYSQELTQQLEQLPNKPGIYQFFDKSQRLLYVGKAKNLKKRVLSYFSSRPQSFHIASMQRDIAQVYYTTTCSEEEAFILELQTIKTLKPRYNIIFRDAKSYPYIVLTSDPYPQLKYDRPPIHHQNFYFGPYHRSKDLKQLIECIQSLFGLRVCTNSVFLSRKRPCLLYETGHCLAPCVGYISPENYQEKVKEAQKFLKGHYAPIEKKWRAEMKQSSDQWNYEQAIHIKKKLDALSIIKEKNKKSEHPLAFDIIVWGECDDCAVISILQIRYGNYVGQYNQQVMHALSADSWDPIIQNFLLSYYSSTVIPDGIILPSLFLQSTMWRSTSNKLLGSQLPIRLAETSQEKDWIALAAQQRDLALQDILRTPMLRQTRLDSLRELCGLSAHDDQFIALDISHTQGDCTVGAIVSFIGAIAQKKDYKIYSLPNTCGNDCLALYCLIFKHYSGKRNLPHLIVIDGGKEQRDSVKKALLELGLEGIPCISLSKGPERRSGEEKLLFCNKTEAVQLSPKHPGFLLLRQMRDEAHAFALKKHVQKREKKSLSSE